MSKRGGVLSLVHGAPPTPEVRAVRRALAALLAVGATLAALASGTYSSFTGSDTGAAAPVIAKSVSGRSDKNQTPADRGDRPWPNASLLSAANELTSSSALTRLLPAVLRPAVVASAAPLDPNPPKTAEPPAPAPYQPVAAGYPFGSASVWRQSVTGAPVAANSSALVRSLTNDVTSLYNGVAAFNFDSYNTAYYTVGPSIAKTDVKFDNCQSKWGEPDGLAEQFAQVPIPSNAVPASGTDAELTIYSPDTDQLWEFWVASHRSDGWYACWGGRMDHVSAGPGYFSGGFGATATGLPVAGGMVSIADAKAGVINHAMSLEIVNPAPWDDFSYPAQRSDGGDTSPSAIPEGTRFRLDPSLNVDALDLTPIAKMVAKAAQQYGFIVTDGSGAVAIQTEDGAAAAADPWPAMMAGVPSYEILANFPWSQLKALPKNWGE